MRSASLCYFLCILIFKAAGQDINITHTETSSGLYYEKIGDVLLAHNHWEFVTSVDYTKYLLHYQLLQIEANKLYDFCQEFQSSICEERCQIIRYNMGSIANTHEVMETFLGIDNRIKRRKRDLMGILRDTASLLIYHLGRELSKSIFGESIDEKLMEQYHQQISELRKNQQNIKNDLEDQRTMFKIDSERKENLTNHLRKNQEDIQKELFILESTKSNNFEEHEKKIKNLYDMLGEIQHKLKQQERQQQLKSDAENIQKSAKNIYEDLEHIEKDVIDNENYINVTRIETKLNSISDMFSFKLSDFQSEQETLLNVIKNANRGFLDPYILTPLDLIEKLQDIQAMLPEDSRLPFPPNFENAKALYNMMKPTIMFHNNNIIFILKIPIVHFKTFETYKMTSYPMAVGSNKYIYVSPKKEYLLITNQKSPVSEYVLSSAADFREFCKDLGSSKYICDQIQHTKVLSTSSECEAQLLYNKNQLAESCNVRVMKLTKPVFIMLQQRGVWIYVVPKIENLIVSCGDRLRDTVPLTAGTGLLHLSGNCTAQTSEFVLQHVTGSKIVAVSKYVSPVNSVIPLADYIDMSKVEAFDETAPESHKQVIHPFDISELDVISVRIKDVVATAHYIVYKTMAVFSFTVNVLIIFKARILRMIFPL